MARWPILTPRRAPYDALRWFCNAPPRAWNYDCGLFARPAQVPAALPGLRVAVRRQYTPM